MSTYGEYERQIEDFESGYLLEEVWTNHQQNNMQHLNKIIIGGVITAIIGVLILIFLNYGYYRLFGILPLLLGLGLTTFILNGLKTLNGKFQEIQNLRNAQDITKLMKLAQKHTRLWGEITFVTAALGDLQDPEAMDVLENIFHYFKSSKMHWNVSLIAELAMNSIDSSERIRQVIDQGTKPKADLEEFLASFNPRTTKILSRHEVIGSTSMITKLPVDVDEEKLLICPLCGGIDTENNIRKWYELQRICPRCKRQLKLNNYMEIKFIN